MKASHIYINAEGVPCIPTIKVPGFLRYDHEETEYQEEFSRVKKSCILIREEDRAIVMNMFYVREIVKDHFYPVEPYEFELADAGVYPFNDHEVARIVRTSDVHNYNVRKHNESSEPKAGPSKELIDEEIEKAAGDPKVNPIRGSGYRVSRDEHERFVIGAKFARDHFKKEIDSLKRALEDCENARDRFKKNPDYRFPNLSAPQCTVCSKFDTLPCFDPTDAALQNCPNYKPNTNATDPEK